MPGIISTIQEARGSVLLYMDAPAAPLPPRSRSCLSRPDRGLLVEYGTCRADTAVGAPRECFVEVCPGQSCLKDGTAFPSFNTRHARIGGLGFAPRGDACVIGKTSELKGSVRQPLLTLNGLCLAFCRCHSNVSGCYRGHVWGLLTGHLRRAEGRDIPLRELPRGIRRIQLCLCHAIPCSHASYFSIWSLGD